MTEHHSRPDYETEIERRLDTVREHLDGPPLGFARTGVAPPEDRWYGELLGRSYDAVGNRSDLELIVPAAVAIELLREYGRVRSELVNRVTADRGEPDVADAERDALSGALLAGDYLHATAYSTLGAVDHPSLGTCFETLTAVSETLVEAFSAAAGRHAAGTATPSTTVDAIAGALGEGAALVGATLAGVDSARRAQFATLGRGLGAARELQAAVETGSHVAPHLVLEPDDRQRRRLADRRAAEATRALRELPSGVDVGRLRPFVAAIDGDRG